ncbi:MAG: signal peptidase II [Deferrisomatales bacterium]
MRRRLVPFAVVAAAVVGLDQATKAWVDAAFQLYESRPVVEGLFHLTYVRNPGAAFGLLAGWGAQWRQPFFVGITAVALGAILWILARLEAGRPWTLAALALVFGGAVGNLIDRIAWGEVIDFLDVFWRGYHWPAFNVADSAITVGMTILIADELFGGRSRRPTPDA